MLALPALILGCSQPAAYDFSSPDAVRSDLIKRYELGHESLEQMFEVCPNDPSIAMFKLQGLAPGGETHLWVPVERITSVGHKARRPHDPERKRLKLREEFVYSVTLEVACEPDNFFCREDNTRSMNLSIEVRDDPATPDVDERLSLLQDDLKDVGYVLSYRDENDERQFKEGPRDSFDWDALADIVEHAKLKPENYSHGASMPYRVPSEYKQEPVAKFGLNAHFFNPERIILKGSDISKRQFETYYDDVVYSNMRVDKVEPDKSMAYISCTIAIRTNVYDKQRCRYEVATPHGIDVVTSVHYDKVSEWRDFFDLVNRVTEAHIEGGEYEQRCR